MNLQSTYTPTRPPFNEWIREITLRKNKEWQRKKQLISKNKKRLKKETLM